jgi:hypothetical protein
LTITPTYHRGAKFEAYLQTATKDANGWYNDVPTDWLAQRATTVQSYLHLERISGTITTEVQVAATTEGDAPLVREHLSVAFDAATSAVEDNGDGVLSLSHTASGSNRAAFIGVGNVDGTAGSLGAVTYGGSGATELWDNVFGTYYGNAGYSFIAPAASAQTVTSTLVDTTPSGHALGVITMTGVDQTTPTGTAATALGDGLNGVSVTVGSVGTDDLVVDNMHGRPTTPVIGANQTLRNTRDATWPTAFRQSTQPGSSGGVMSWTFTGGADYDPAYIGAVAFKPTAAGGGSAPMFRGS